MLIIAKKYETALDIITNYNDKQQQNYQKN